MVSISCEKVVTEIMTWRRNNDLALKGKMAFKTPFVTRELSFEFFYDFSKIAWAKNFEISFYGSVFDTEKHGQNIFPKFELFGFLRN